MTTKPNKMSHTPTPWNDQHKYLNTTLSLLSGGDYARAKACVNACAEFSDPKIDIGLLKLDNEQKAKLLASCETALAERDLEIKWLTTHIAILKQYLEDGGKGAEKLIKEIAAKDTEIAELKARVKELENPWVSVTDAPENGSLVLTKIYYELESGRVAEYYCRVARYYKGKQDEKGRFFCPYEHKDIYPTHYQKINFTNPPKPQQ